MAQVKMLSCDLCLEPHESVDCQAGNPFAPGSSEQVSFVNYNRNYANQNANHQNPNPNNNPYSNTYNPKWRNHHNFSWRDNQQPPQPQANFKPPRFNQPQQVERKSTVEELFSKYMSKLDVLMETQDLALKKLDTKVDQLAQHSQAAIQNLEVQIGQLARGSQACLQGTLISDMVINPKEQCKAISLRSWRTVELPKELVRRRRTWLKKM